MSKSQKEKITLRQDTQLSATVKYDLRCPCNARFDITWVDEDDEISCGKCDRVFTFEPIAFKTKIERENE